MPRRPAQSTGVRKPHNPHRLQCPFASSGCKRTFRNRSGLTKHVRTQHPSPPRLSPSTSPEPAGIAFSDVDTSIAGSIAPLTPRHDHDQDMYEMPEYFSPERSSDNESDNEVIPQLDLEPPPTPRTPDRHATPQPDPPHHIYHPLLNGKRYL